MDPTHNFISLGFAAALAFVTAAAVVALDCWRQNSAEFSYSTHPVLLDAVGLAFCSACGFIAVSAFLYIESNHSSWIAKLIPISADSPFAGALVVGVSVMVIIRSKIFQLGKDSGDFGLEFLYQLAREGVLARLRRRRANEKGRFVVAAMPKIAGMANFAEELDNRLRDLLRDKRLETYRKERGAIAPPDRGFAAADPLWNIYYKTLLRNAVDFAGIGPIEEWLVTLQSMIASSGIGAGVAIMLQLFVVARDSRRRVIQPLAIALQLNLAYIKISLQDSREVKQELP